MKIELDDYELKMRLGGLSEEEFQEFKKIGRASCRERV